MDIVYGLFKKICTNPWKECQDKITLFSLILKRKNIPKDIRIYIGKIIFKTQIHIPDKYFLHLDSIETTLSINKFMWHEKYKAYFYLSYNVNEYIYLPCVFCKLPVSHPKRFSFCLNHNSGKICISKYDKSKCDLFAHYLCSICFTPLCRYCYIRNIYSEKTIHTKYAVTENEKNFHIKWKKTNSKKLKMI